MSSLYAPNIANNPASFTLPSDGDAKPVASVRVALEGLADLAGRCRAFLTAGLSGAELDAPTVLGVATFSGAIHGDVGFLNIGQAGETARFLGGVLFAPGQIVQFGGSAQFNGTMELLTGNVFTIDVGATIQVQGAAYLSGLVNVSGTEHIASGGFLTVDLGGALTIANGGALTIESGGALRITVGGTLLIDGGGTLSSAGVIVNTGSGHIRKRVFTGPDADSQSYGIIDADLIVIPDQSATRTWTLSTTGADEGAEIEFTAYACVSNKVTISGLGSFQNLTGYLLFTYARAVFHAGAWMLVDRTIVV